MKTLKIIPILFLLYSCVPNKPDNPQKTIENFYKAIENEDSYLAKKLSTGETHKYVEESLGESFSLKIIDCKEDNRKAECNCFLNGNEEEVKLKLVEDKWKVHIKTSFLKKFIKHNIKNKLTKISKDHLIYISKPDSAINKLKQTSLDDLIDALNNDKIINDDKKAKLTMELVNNLKAQYDSTGNVNVKKAIKDKIYSTIGKSMIIPLILLNPGSCAINPFAS